MKLTTKINKLLHDSNLSSYRISKDTGLAQPTVYELQKGNYQVGNMRLKNAILLAQYYDNKINQK